MTEDPGAPDRQADPRRRRRRVPDGGTWGSGPWGPPWAGARDGRRRRDGHWRGRPRHGARLFGCLLIGLILFVGLLTAVATWIAGALLGVVAPGAIPSGRSTVAVIVVIAVVLLVGARTFGSAVRPLAELASAAERLADGEPGVRVRSRGPGPVRGLVASFNAMAERLDRARADRQALLADVTHELRTPLTVIAGGVEAMLDGVHPLDEDHLAPLLAETRVMDRLLEDLRTVSLAEAGVLPLHREPVDVRGLAADVVAGHRTAAESRGVELRLADGDAVDAVVDPVRVREIVSNLVANALRHTPRGGSVDLAVGAETGHAVVTVRDTGEGIPPADLGRVFERFQRRADSGGSGLGLTIARDLAAAHGGTIDAESDGVPGHGATFTLRLPIRD